MGLIRVIPTRDVNIDRVLSEIFKFIISLGEEVFLCLVHLFRKVMGFLLNFSTFMYFYTKIVELFGHFLNIF